MSMPRVLIVAYGNSMRSDDGVAWRAADELERTFSGSKIASEVEILRLHQLVPELAEAVSHAEAVIFLDAVSSGAGTEPGELRCEETSPPASRTSFSHQLSPSVLLALSQQLFGASPRAYAVTLAGESFDHGESLSPAIEAAIPKLVARTEALVRQLLSESFPQTSTSLRIGCS
jgi:hydrogenase maturation protease